MTNLIVAPIVAKTTMAQNRRNKGKKPAEGRAVGDLRIIGGKFRGSRLRYSGRPDTRPMKDRVREATFNLVGPAIKGKHAIDLFAGTGALGLEAVSRGAKSATLIERHVPSCRVIEENVQHLGLQDCTQVVAANAFIWLRQEPVLPSIPWLVFFSPPYDFYVERIDEMLSQVQRCLEMAPSGSILVVEADERFDYETLPNPEDWIVRSYPPAFVGILRDTELVAVQRDP